MCKLQTTPQDIVPWIAAPVEDALNLSGPPADGTLRMIPRRSKKHAGGFAV